MLITDLSLGPSPELWLSANGIIIEMSHVTFFFLFKCVRKVNHKVRIWNCDPVLAKMGFPDFVVLLLEIMRVVGVPDI